MMEERGQRWQNEDWWSQGSPWLTVKEAADRARCGVKTIYREVKASRLRAARIGGRRQLRFQASWIDDWLIRQSNVVEVEVG